METHHYTQRYINLFNQKAETPSMRGGHQMCMDSLTGKIYLLGGWDGGKELADFWTFDVSTSVWCCISTDTRR
jgi:hypothetical protein